MTKKGTDYEGMDDIWAPYADIDEQMFQEDHLESNLRGRGFSTEDWAKMKILIKCLIEKNILTFIEKKIRNLELNLSDTRKGIKNRFLNLLKK